MIENNIWRFSEGGACIGAPSVSLWLPTGKNYSQKQKFSMHNFLEIKLSKKENFSHASNSIISRPVESLLESRVIAFESQVTSVLVAVTQPLPKNASMAEDHEAPELEKLSKAWTRGRKVTESRQRASGIESVAGQCRTRRCPLQRRRERTQRA